MSDKLQVVNPHAAHPASMIALAKSLWLNRELIVQMTKREIVGRYKGSTFGRAWAFLNPFFMLAVYTIIFSEIFKSRWGDVGENESKTQFALVLFAGLIVLGMLSEVLNRAPSLILENINYVKKVVFPVEILPIIAVAAALFQCFINSLVLMMAFFIFNGYLHWTFVFLPLVLLPLAILTSGLAFMLASMGVYFRDVGQVVGLLTSGLMFVSPVFYPITAVPTWFRPLIMANPLTFIIDQSREVLILGHAPNWLGLANYALAATLIAWIGYAWFQMTRRGFADVL